MSIRYERGYGALVVGLLALIAVALGPGGMAEADAQPSTHPPGSAPPPAQPAASEHPVEGDSTPDLVGTLLEQGSSVAELGTRVLGPQEDITAKQLWEREPLGFDAGTLAHCWRLLSDLPKRTDEIVRFVRQNAVALGLFAGLTVVALVLAVILRRRVAIRIATELGQSLQPVRNRMPAFASRVTVSAVRLLTAVLAPTAILGAYYLVHALIEYDAPWFQALGDLLVGWTMLALALGLLHEVLLGSLVAISKGDGRRLYRDLRRPVVIGFLGLVTIAIARRAGADPEILALATFSVQLALLIVAGLALRWRSAILGLFPQFENRVYRTFLNWLRRFYVPAFVFTFAVLVAGLVGYRRLATFLLVRSWLLVAIFVVTVGLHSLILGWLRRRISPEEEPTPEGQSLYTSIVLLVTYVTVIGVTLLFLHIVGALAPLTRALGTELLSIGDQHLSFLVIIKAIAVILVFVFSGRLISNYLDFQVYPSLRVDPGVATAINTMIMGLLVGVGTIFGLTTVGLDLRVLTFFAGALGLGIGFGLQNYAANLIGGLTLIFGRHLRRGDIVTVGDTAGTVQQVGIRATRIRSLDAIEYTVPNSAFLDNQIINWSHSSPLVRVHVPMGVSYGSDPERVREVFLAVAQSNRFVESRPAPQVWFAGFGDSSLDFELLVWINIRKISTGEAKSQLYFAAFAALKEAGIEIPFPQRDLHIRSGLPTSPPLQPAVPPKEPELSEDDQHQH